MKPGRLLILSDGKPGHVNQSIAFARHLGCDYRLCKVGFRSRLAKGLSHLLDRCGCYTGALFAVEEVTPPFAAVVSAGSETYYANKVLARQLGVKAVAIMLPRGYRYDFDLIVAQHHDAPPPAANLLELPVNLSYVEPQGLVAPTPGKKVVALVVGGDSRHARLDPEQLREQVAAIFGLFPDHEFWLTTSRRTAPEAEAVLRQFPFTYAVFYSQRQVNPIPDFLQHGEYVFVTADSTSMISEAVSFGTACIEVLPLAGEPAANGKFERLFRHLRALGCLHLFDGRPGQANGKVDLQDALKGIEL